MHENGRRAGKSGVAALLFAFVACGGITQESNDHAATGGATNAGAESASLYARDFDQSCLARTNCAPVREGEQCGCLTCPNAAINDTALPRWGQARYERGCSQSTCSSPTVCERLVVDCIDSRCTLVRPPVITADTYDRRCTEDDHCSVVPLGSMCDCPCEFVGVSVSGYARWREDVTANPCTKTGAPCECPWNKKAGCVVPAGDTAGSCEVTD